MTNPTEQKPGEEIDWAAETAAEDKVIARTASLLGDKYKVDEDGVLGMIDTFTNTETIACHLGDLRVTRGPDHTMIISRVGEEANETLEVVDDQAPVPAADEGEDKKAA
jgi:hypothetical protein